MSDAFAHCVRLARSLALTSTLLLPACGGAEDPAPDPASPSPPGSSHGGESGAGAEVKRPAGDLAYTATASATPPAPDPQGSDAGASDAGQSSGPHTSGPLPPPELPGGFALA
jgi:hypothetical protein